MGAIGIKLDASDFFKNLKAYSDKVMKEAKNEIATTALLVETDAKKEEFGMRIRFGRLKNSIHTATSSSDGFSYKDDAGNSYQGGIKADVDLDKLSVAVGTNVEYAVFINNKTNFLQNALENNRAEFRKNIAKILK